MGTCLWLEISEVRRLAGAACNSKVSRNRDMFVGLGKNRMGVTSHSMPSLYILQRMQKITLVFSMTACVGAQRLDKETELQVIPDKYQPNKDPWRP